MRQRWRRNEKRKGEGCGNDGAVESVESRKQASHSFHEPLGNLANSRRDSHISTAPAAKADGKVENQHQVFHFPTATISLMSKKEKPKARAGFALRVRGGAPRRLSIKRQLSLIGRNSCRRPKEIVDAGHPTRWRWSSVIALPASTRTGCKPPWRTCTWANRFCAHSTNTAF